MSVKNVISAFIGTVFIIMVFACPALEITKLILFRLAKDEITLNNEIIEYIYLVVTFTFPLGLIFTAVKNRCCNLGGLMSHISEQICCLPFLILIIASIYAHMTSQEIAPIPDSCPSNYPYKLSITRAACFIRLINFIIMWVFISLLLMLTIMDCFGCFPRKEKDKTIESRLSGFFPPDRDDDIGKSYKK